MSEEIKFDHFKDINELLEHIDLWYREDDIEYTRWFGLEDLYNLKIYIRDLQQKIEQLENIRKETIEYINNEIFKRTILIGVGTKKYTRNILDNILNILNKGE